MMVLLIHGGIYGLNDFKIAKNEGIQPEVGLYRITPD